MKKLLSVLLLVLLISLCAISYADLKTTVPIKNVKFKTVDGQQFDLYKTLEEKDLVLIDLWYLDCPGCIDLLAAMKNVYDEYKDRVEFVSINGYDSVKEVSRFCTTRELPWIFACNGVGRSWTRFYPTTYVINKDHYVLQFDFLDTPNTVRYTLDTALGMTPEKFKEEAERGIGYGASRMGENIQDFYRIVSILQHPYNINGNMSLTVECDGLQRIVVEDNLNMLQGNDKVGEFYLVPQDTDHLKVTVHTEKGFKDNKAYMVNNMDFNETPFRKAVKNKNDYTFEVELGEGTNTYSFYASDRYFSSITKDSYVGFCCFRSTKEASAFFNTRANWYKCSLPWHVAEEEIATE